MGMCGASPPGYQDQRPADPMVGSVLVFKKGTDVAKAQRFLDELLRRGILEQPAYAHDYDTRYGGPVWYIP